MRARAPGYGRRSWASGPRSIRRTPEAQLVHASEITVERAVRAALKDAGCEPSSIDLVACAASGVSRVDLAEEEGLGPRVRFDVATVATKGLWGETFGAAAALSMAAAVGYLSGIAPRGRCCAGKPLAKCATC